MHGGDTPRQWPGTTEATSDGWDAVALYDTYADALFGFCVGLAHDRERAERALYDTLVAGAESVRGLREPSRVRGLLYALARSECRRTASGGQGPGVVEQVLAAGAAVWTVPDRHRLLPLTPYALWAVDESERIALDLCVRHGLSVAEIADVLALPERRVARLLGRGRIQFEQSLAVYAVATHGRRDCPELAMLLPDGGAAVESTLRQPLHLHVDSCPDCAVLRPGEPDATALLAGGVLPAAPLAVRTRLLGAGAAGGASVRLTRVGRNGFPKGTGRPRSRVPVAAGCLVAAGLVLGFVVLGPTDGEDPNAPVALGTAEVVPARPVPAHPSPTVAPSVPASAAPAASGASSRPAGSSAPTTKRATKSTAKATATKSAKPTTAVAPIPAASGPGTLAAANVPPDRSAVQPRSGDVEKPPVAGELAWSASRLNLGVGDTPKSVVLTATKASVPWSLVVSENDWLTVSAPSGTLADGQSTTITFVADPNRAPAGTWEVVISTRPGGRTLTVEGIGTRAFVR
jgi:DNA-directed RNA polymerase specialized sigma24 family protein